MKYEFDGKLLKGGAKGEAVKALQAVLTKLGHDTGGIDGDFGAKTRAAVKAVQEKAGLSVDGIVGKNTAGAIQAQIDEMVAKATAAANEKAAAAKQQVKKMAQGKAAAAEKAVKAQAPPASKAESAADKVMGSIFGKK